MTLVAEMSLHEWYANPLDHKQAQELLQQANDRLQSACLNGSETFHCHLQEMIARFWLDQNIEINFRALQQTTSKPALLALLEIVYGQLLTSRKLTGAIDHLTHGFNAASGLLPAIEYFKLSKQLELLHCLPYSDTPAPAQDVDSLLAEAAVIKRLQESRGGPKQYPLNPKDTTG